MTQKKIEILLMRILQMIVDHDDMFTMIDCQNITAMHESGWIVITHEEDVSGTFLTETGKNKLEELIKKNK